MRRINACLMLLVLGSLAGAGVVNADPKEKGPWCEKKHEKIKAKDKAACQRLGGVWKTPGKPDAPVGALVLDGAEVPMPKGGERAAAKQSKPDAPVGALGIGSTAPPPMPKGK